MVEDSSKITGGTYSFTAGGKSTPPLPYNATPAEQDAAIANLYSDDILMPFDPEWTGRPPTTIYAVKYRDVCQDGKTRTYIFLLGSKAAYEQRVAGPEKGQGLKGTVVWEAITPAVVKKKPQQGESLF